jgi:hypothetical protein
MNDKKNENPNQNKLMTNLEILSESDAARKLCLSQITLQRARTRGEIAFYKAGRRVLYSIAQLRQFLTKLERNGSQSQETEGK